VYRKKVEEEKNSILDHTVPQPKLIHNRMESIELDRRGVALKTLLNLI